MKKMNLKFFGLRAKIVLPLFLLVGLFLSSATSTMAQDFKPLDDARVIVKNEVTAALKAGAVEGATSWSGFSSNTLEADYKYFSYLDAVLNPTLGVEGAINETYQKLQLVYPDSPMKDALFLTHQRALEILTY